MNILFIVPPPSLQSRSGKLAYLDETQYISSVNLSPKQCPELVEGHGEIKLMVNENSVSQCKSLGLSVFKKKGLLLEKSIKKGGGGYSFKKLFLMQRAVEERFERGLL